MRRLDFMAILVPAFASRRGFLATTVMRETFVCESPVGSPLIIRLAEDMSTRKQLSIIDLINLLEKEIKMIK